MAFPSGFAHMSRRRTRRAGSGRPGGRAGEGLAAQEEAELRGPAAHTASPFPLRTQIITITTTNT